MYVAKCQNQSHKLSLRFNNCKIIKLLLWNWKYTAHIQVLLFAVWKTHFIETLLYPIIQISKFCLWLHPYWIPHVYSIPQVRYRAQQGMTRLAVGKMLAVWLLAFLLYGPAIIFWEDVAGKSIVPADECFAEFYCTWYFLLSASTFEFFSPFISVTFFNLSIYLNIQRRNKSRTAQRGAEKEDGWRVADGGASPSSAVFFVRTRKVSSSEPAAISAVIEEDMEISPSSSGDPSCSQSVSLSLKTASKKKGALSCWLKTRVIQSQALSRNGEHSRLSRDKKIAKSLAVIVCVFGVCWAPYTLLMIIRAACSGTCIEHHWYEVTFWLLWLNSAINPFLYPLCHSSFRRAFTKILCPKRQSVGPHEDTPSCQWQHTRFHTVCNCQWRLCLNVEAAACEMIMSEKISETIGILIVRSKNFFLFFNFPQRKRFHFGLPVFVFQKSTLTMKVNPVNWWNFQTIGKE